MRWRQCQLRHALATDTSAQLLAESARSDPGLAPAWQLCTRCCWSRVPRRWTRTLAPWRWRWAAPPRFCRRASISLAFSGLAEGWHSLHTHAGNVATEVLQWEHTRLRRRRRDCCPSRRCLAASAHGLQRLRLPHPAPRPAQQRRAARHRRRLRRVLQPTVRTGWSPSTPRATTAPHECSHTGTGGTVAPVLSLCTTPAATGLVNVTALEVALKTNKA